MDQNDASKRGARTGRKRWIGLWAALGLLLVPGCKKQEMTELPMPAFYKSADEAEQEKIADDARALLGKYNFAGLDTMAAELRGPRKKIYPTGSWGLGSFYDGIDCLPDEATDVQWQAHLMRLRQWVTGRPLSITPRVALVQALVSYAWKARGSGYAETITPLGQRLMDERLAEAFQTLVQARNLKERCPYWSTAAQRVALGQGWDKATYDKVCVEGLASYPDNYGVYFHKEYHLQPRWYGKDGEWEAFAARSADRMPGDDGDILYARMVWSIDRDHLYKNIFTETAIQWPRTKRSFETLLKHFPDSLSVQSGYARLACNAGDWSTARRMFKAVGGHVSRPIWRSIQTFARFREDAYAHEWDVFHPFG